MEEKLKNLINELEVECIKLNKELQEKPDMIWTYKSAKMSTISVNKTIIVKLNNILNPK